MGQLDATSAKVLSKSKVKLFVSGVTAYVTLSD